MIEIYLERPHTLRRFRASPVGAHLDVFAAELHASGFGWRAGGEHLRRVVHLGNWASSRGIAVEAFDEDVIAAFGSHLPTCTCPGLRVGHHRKARSSAWIFLAHLRRRGVVAPPRSGASPTKASELANEFCEWMQRHRGLTAASLRTYQRVATRLLDRLGTEASSYTASAVRAAVLAETGEHGISKAKSVANVTRAYLRYTAMIGRCSPNLADAVSRVAGWKLTSLPRHLPPADVDRLLASCDSATPAGLRDRAVLLFLSRLGLRAGDVVGLQLSDIDWSDCTVRVTGKGRREARLPLSQEVGDAVLSYLERGRPRASTRHLFIRLVAPHRALASNAVSGIVIRAIDRAGVDAPVRGAHLLRHSAAMAMLREGASLHGIGTVLRHQSVETTAHYARVDAEFLAQVAQPWIEVAPC